MKPIHHTLAATALAFAALAPFTAPVARAAADPSVPQVVADGLRITVIGEVTAVDAAARTVAIKGPQGNKGVFAVDPAVKNLDQVKVGDRVRIDYKAAVALALLKNGDGIREKVEADSATQAQPGAKPGAAVLKTTTIVANVLSVNTKKKHVKLQGPEGRVVDVQVRDPKVLKAVKVGDQVVADVTETLAVNVRPAPAGK